MTTTEFLTLVANGVSNAEIMEEAKRRLDEHMAKIERRRQTPMTDAQKENEELCNQIMSILDNQIMTVSDIAIELNISTQKASMLCRRLVATEELTTYSIPYGYGSSVTVYVKTKKSGE